MRYFYSDNETREALKKSNNIVYLYGSFIGYNNFGDILQLKYAIDFYKKHTEYTPVVLLHLPSIENEEHLSRLKQWYNQKYFVFLSDIPVDATSVSLSLINEVSPATLLHIYGGGFLNEYWGKGIIERTIDIIKQLGIEDYIFSGQQVEQNISKMLDSTLFATKNHYYSALATWTLLIR